MFKDQICSGEGQVKKGPGNKKKRERAGEEGRSAQRKGAELLHTVIRIPVHGAKASDYYRPC